MNQKIKLRLLSLITALFFLLPVSSFSQAIPPKHVAKSAIVKTQVLPLDSAVKVGKLPNGFTYYIRKNIEPKNRVTMYLANKVGSVLENDDQQGLAHFMEHMSFNGT
jgi:zinc protease